FDLPVNLEPASVRHAGGPLVAAFSGIRLLDVANVLLTVAPLAAVVPVLVATRSPRIPSAPRAWVLVALVVPLLVALPFFQHPFGLFGPWETAVGAGAAASLAAGALAGDAVRRGPRPSLAAAVVLSAAVPVLQELWLASFPERSLARIESYAQGPPLRSEA